MPRDCQDIEGKRSLIFISRKPAQPGSYNMAFDEYLFESAERLGSHCWRLYLWDPPAVSIGRNQQFERAVRMEVARQNGIQMVKRPTGGRAIWHSGDVCFTHSGVTPGTSDTISAFKDDYMRAAKAVVRFLEALGISAGISPGNPSDRLGLAKVKAPCFQSSGRYEVTAGGLKIAGIAQYRSTERFLIQGSIRLEPIDEMNGGLFFEDTDEGRASFEGFCRMVTSINEQTGRNVSFGELSEAFMRSVGGSADDLRDPLDADDFLGDRRLEGSVAE